MAAAVVVALMALAGCSAADDDEAPDTSAYTDGSRVPKTEKEWAIPELPLARHEFGAGDTKRTTRAQARLVQRCMADHGFADFPLDPALPGSMNTVSGQLVSVAMATPFGELDLGEARRRGYGWDSKTAEKAAAKKDRPMTDAEFEVLYNSDRSTGRTVNGRAIPENGCSGQAAARLTEGVDDTTRMYTYTSRRSQAPAKEARQDPDVSRALRTWAACVEDTVGEWWAGEARAQSADVRSHRATYEAVRRDQEVVRANIRDVLGD
ncbi:hypothetical protein [Streptomyces niveus]|uniref:hypothetical protein n=1 Tax=Streptomyces niveus TaxID=193462 RepID=UPI00342E53A8